MARENPGRTCRETFVGMAVNIIQEGEMIMQSKFRSYLAAGLAALAAFVAMPAFTAQAAEDDGWIENLEPVRVNGTIVDVAVHNSSFSTLVSALGAADLVTTLQGKGPFTVFAPTNAAFGKIPAPILNYLLASPAALKSVLLYHVVAGEKDLKHAFETRVLGTVQGEKVFARVVFRGEKAVLEINNSSVVLRPIQADNGIIYVIDSVLLPQFK